MRTSDVVLSIGLLGLAFGLSPAVSFDGTRTPDGPAVVALPPGGNSLGSATPLAPVPVPPLPPGPAGRR